MVIQTSHWIAHKMYEMTQISYVTIYKTIFGKNVEGRQSAKNRQIAKQSIS